MKTKGLVFGFIFLVFTLSVLADTIPNSQVGYAYNLGLRQGMQVSKSISMQVVSVNKEGIVYLLIKDGWINHMLIIRQGESKYYGAYSFTNEGYSYRNKYENIVRIRINKPSGVKLSPRPFLALFFGF